MVRDQGEPLQIQQCLVVGLLAIYMLFIYIYIYYTYYVFWYYIYIYSLYVYKTCVYCASAVFSSFPVVAPNKPPPHLAANPKSRRWRKQGLLQAQELAEALSRQKVEFQAKMGENVCLPYSLPLISDMDPQTTPQKKMDLCCPLR